jgi:hypothetical protein
VEELIVNSKCFLGRNKEFSKNFLLPSILFSQSQSQFSGYSMSKHEMLVEPEDLTDDYVIQLLLKEAARKRDLGKDQGVLPFL